MMPKNHHIHVRNGDGYDVIIGSGLLSKLDIIIPQARQIFLVSDSNVSPLYLETIAKHLHVHNPKTMVVDAGETSKNWDQAGQVIDFFLSHKLERQQPVVAIGGGVIGDLVGFSAACSLRGVPLFHVPTTLLAQVDSSIGGKTGVNSTHGKNLIGNFYHPNAVICDVDTLRTLEPRQLSCGYAEVVKYALINDRGFFTWLEKNAFHLQDDDTNIRLEVVRRCVEAKRDIVEKDEKEKGLRALLNLGHTFAHALETVDGYSDRLFHGEAVAIGLMAAFDLSIRLKLCPPEDKIRLGKYLTNMRLPTSAGHLVRPGFTVEALMDIIASDKKVHQGTVHFILSRGIGRAFIANDIDDKDVKLTLENMLQPSPHHSGIEKT